MVASVGLLSYYSIYNPVEQFRVPLFSFTGSRSPTSVIELQWMAPLSLFLVTSPSREQKLRPTRIREIIWLLLNVQNVDMT